MISSHPPTLFRFAKWFTEEWLSSWASCFFGLHTGVAQWFFHARSGATGYAFATILPAGRAGTTSALAFIVTPLLAGSVCQWVGLTRRSAPWVQVGTMLQFFVFLAALASCCAGNRWGTGVPAYAFLVGISARSFLYRSATRFA